MPKTGRVLLGYVLKGHDFSRASKAAKSTKPSGPEGCSLKLTHYSNLTTLEA
jgi:hypothetical protein